MVGGVRADPGDDPFGVDEVAGKRRGATEAVVRADAHPAVSREPEEEGPRVAALVARPEVPAVEMDQHRSARSSRTVAVEVELVVLPGRTVRDVVDPLDIAATEDERGEQRADGREPAPAGRGAQPHVDGIAPIVAESVAQRVLEYAARRQSPRRDDHEPDDRERRDSDGQPTAERVDVTLTEGEHGRGENQGDRNEREFVDDEPDEEAHARNDARPAHRRDAQPP